MKKEVFHMENIRGSWEYERKNHTVTHVCNGIIIKKKNNWFEGYLKEVDIESGKSNLGFIFGLFFNNKVIELFYCHEGFTSRFHSEKENNNYVGTFSQIDSSIEIPIGSCSFSTSFSNENREKIQNRINLSRAQLDYKSKTFYVKVFDNMELLYLNLSGYQRHNANDLETILGIGKSLKNKIEKKKI